MKAVHLLNGDELLHRFPNLCGDKIVLRECLVEGVITGNTWEEFIENRQVYIDNTYRNSDSNYRKHTVEELEKLRAVNHGSDIYFWFEDDLFCQVNFWFACSLIVSKSDELNCFFVRAKAPLQRGFGEMSGDELVTAFNQKIPMTAVDVQNFTAMWLAFQAGNLQEISALGQTLSPNFGFIQHAISALLNLHFISSSGLNFFEEVLWEIILQQQDKTDFDSIFQVFTKEASILGFGDLQVKRMYDKLLRNV